MDAWLDRFAAALSSWPPPLAYAALAACAFLENVVPPVPGDTVVVLSAYLAGRGVLHWLPVYGATCIGGTAGFLVMYWLGATRGREFVLASRRRSWIFPRERLERAEGWLQRSGPWLVLGNRFLTGIRSVIAFAAGVAHIGWRRVAWLSLASMALWNALLLGAGMALGEHWSRVGPLLARYQRWVLVALLAALAALYLRRRASRRQAAVDVDSPRTGP